MPGLRTSGLAGLAPTTHAFLIEGGVQDVDARHKGEHDGSASCISAILKMRRSFIADEAVAY